MNPCANSVPMSNKTNQEIYKVAANGNGDALFFLQAWCLHTHAIDDFIDNKVRDRDKFLALLVEASAVFTCSFYQQHAPSLEPVVLLINSAYGDSMKWEKADMEWQRQWADTLRFSGNEMVIKVAEICGGYRLARDVSTQLREDSWTSHHNESVGV